MTANDKLMKNGLGASAVGRVSKALATAWPPFLSADFIRDANKGLESLELKDRVRHIISVMGVHLPSSFPKTAYFLGAIRDHWPEGRENEDKRHMFAAWPIIDYVAEYGLNQIVTLAILVVLH